MDVTTERLGAARKVLVRIVQASDDGAKFVPMILEPERLIASAADLDDELARILSEAV